MKLKRRYFIALQWIESKIAENIEKINHSYDKFRISETLMITYKTIWDDYCSWFLEMINLTINNL